MWKPVTISISALVLLTFAGLAPAAAQSANRDDTACLQSKGFDESAIGNCSRAIASGRLRGANLAIAYNNRGVAYRFINDYDRAISDFNDAIRLNPNLASAHGQRGVAYSLKGEHDRALTDLNAAVRLNPKDASNHANRGFVFLQKGDNDRSIVEYTEALRIDPRLQVAYGNRGRAYYVKRDYDRAIADLTEAVRLNPKDAGSYQNRGWAHNDKGDHDRALADMRASAALGHKDGPDFVRRIEQQMAQRAPVPAPVVVAPSPAPSAAPAQGGPRVALVIGNGKYRTVPELANPANDARDLAAVLRDLGFKVIEGYDLDSAGMRAKVGEFGAAMTGATTTLFFYAGHGIQVGDKNYLIPVDARLERPSALSTEAVSVDTILVDMETEKRINLVFLDACRDNPMSRSLAQAFGAGRSAAVGQGLAQLNAGIGTLITFATSPNKTALDGIGRNSPFTAALLKHIRTPDLEVRTLLTRVRADVIRETNERQVPWDHSSLTGEFYFRRGG